MDLEIILRKSEENNVTFNEVLIVNHTTQQICSLAKDENEDLQETAEHLAKAHGCKLKLLNMNKETKHEDMDVEYNPNNSVTLFEEE